MPIFYNSPKVMYPEHRAPAVQRSAKKKQTLKRFLGSPGPRHGNGGAQPGIETVWVLRILPCVRDRAVHSHQPT